MATMSQVKKIASHLMLGMSVLFLAACTNSPTAGSKTNAVETEANIDPFEPWNRTVFHFNYVVDGAILKPATIVYRSVMPEKGQEMVHNALENIYTPVTFANSVMQGDIDNSFASFWRFFINTTFGIGGMFDVASEAGLKMRVTDFGETLGMAQCEPGAYMVLPIIGPSNTRDAIGRMVDALINPFNHVDEGAAYALWTATAVDQRHNNAKLLDSVYSTSLDPYSTFRSGYMQKRENSIKRAIAEREKSWQKAGFKPN